MENIVERIRQLCADRNIPVSKLEEDLGYGNGYLNPKKVSDIKYGRLIEILDYLGTSYEEFFHIGSEETQAISTALVQLKKASPSVYESVMNGWFAKDGELEPEEHDLIALYRKADKHDKETVWQVLSRYAEDTVSAAG